MANWNFGQEDFDRLLSWLDPDQNHAGKRYESIRRKLILIFASRGWAFPEEMADDCINRVIRKLPEIKEQYKGPPEAYFYGVAKIIELEWRRKDRPIEIPAKEGISSETEERLACLDRCLGKLPNTRSSSEIRRSKFYAVRSEGALIGRAVGKQMPLCRFLPSHIGLKGCP